MIYPKCLVFSLALVSFAITGCSESEQLKIGGVGSNTPGSTVDGLPISGQVTVAPADTDSGNTNADGIPQPQPQPATPPPVDSDVPDGADDAGTDSDDLPAAEGPTVNDTSGVPGTTPDSAPDPAPTAVNWWKPKASENLTWQWQLQGEIDTTLPVQVYNVDIDVPQEKLDELNQRGIKIICYFSAGTVESFRSDESFFPQDIIGEQYEDLVDERWVDYGNIDALAEIMRARMDKCKSKGFHAVEIDNVDAHNFETRNAQGDVVNIGTNFMMTLDESIAYVRWLTNEAHSRGLGIGLKNAEEMVADVVDEVDWMLVEDCFYDSWCTAATAFIDADKPVFMAEYDELVPDFTPACELAKSLGYTAIWRDTSLSTALYLACE